jgi:hypothetical protein
MEEVMVNGVFYFPRPFVPTIRGFAEHAVSCGLWGHAALLSCRMMSVESGAFERMLAAFSESLRPQDPLKTLYQLVLHQTSPIITVSTWRVL